MLFFYLYLAGALAWSVYGTVNLAKRWEDVSGDEFEHVMLTMVSPIIWPYMFIFAAARAYPKFIERRNKARELAAEQRRKELAPHMEEVEDSLRSKSCTGGYNGTNIKRV